VHAQDQCVVWRAEHPAGSQQEVNRRNSQKKRRPSRRNKKRRHSRRIKKMEHSRRDEKRRHSSRIKKRNRRRRKTEDFDQNSCVRQRKHSSSSMHGRTGSL
jgi:hypothetical protein